MQTEPVVHEVEKTRSRWRVFDPAYIMLVTAVVLAITFSVRVSRKISALQIREREYSGALCGPQATQVGDIVPAFNTVDLQGHTAVFARIRIGRLRKPMDIGRKFKTDFSFERKPL